MDQPLNSQSMPPKEPPKQLGLYSRRLIFGSLIIILTAAIIIYLPKNDKQSSTNTANPTNTDPTANWQTYTNDQYGFVIKYPSDLYEVILPPEDQGATLVNIYPKVVKDTVGVSIIIMPNTKLDEHVAKVIANWKAANAEDIEIREANMFGETVVKTISLRASKNSPLLIGTFVQKNNDLFHFGFLDSGTDSVEWKIFTSFKFTR